jgi:osmotically-inducible protein OsmY
VKTRPDDELAAAVRAELRQEPHVDARLVAVRAERGIVTLLGTVATPLARHAASRAAERVTGALIVDNRLLVRPTVRFDDSDATLRASALQALADSGLAVGDEIDVQVHGGWLTLLGRLRSVGERAAATESVASLPGVAGLTNAIQVLGAA